MTDKATRAEEAYHKAFEYDVKYGCCPQCVLTAVKETVGYVSDETIKASHGLSGGGALSGAGACGALTGGLMALGAKRGRDADKLDKGRCMKNFQEGNKLVERFRETFGGIACQELQQRFTGNTYDMWQPEQYQAFSDARGDQCAHATAEVTRWVVEML